MSVPSGTYHLGPDKATLAVRTGRAGAAAKAGHDLLLHVTSWEATLELAEGAARGSIELAADPTSLRVIEGTGGIQSLGEDDRANIEQTIDEEVLERQPIEFRSTRVEGEGERLEVDGELRLAGQTNVVSFELAVDAEGALSAGAVVTQSDWGMKPYSALFGALKVADEVEVSLEGRL